MIIFLVISLELEEDEPLEGTVGGLQDGGEGEGELI